jgi:predicted GIY-YIG superfamily endonuclease
MKSFFVYIIANPTNSTIYIGVTNDLQRRMWEHQNKVIKGFPSSYNITRLVYYETYSDPGSESLIKAFNPKRRDLSEELFAQRPRKFEEDSSIAFAKRTPLRMT